MELGLWPDASQGEGRVINVEDWAEFRRLHRAEGMSVTAIVRRLGLARNTVRAALRSQGPPMSGAQRTSRLMLNENRVPS